MKEKLMQDLKQAMKENNIIQKNTIQLLRAAIAQEEKDKQITLNENQIEDIVMKEKKKRQDALSQFEKVNRTDLIEQTKREIGYLNKYLPQPVTEYELEITMKEIIDSLQATKKDIGKIMRLGKEKFGNRVDGKQLSDLVKKLLEVD